MSGPDTKTPLERSHPMFRTPLFLLFAALASVQPAAAQDEVSNRQIDALEQEIAELRARLDTVEAGRRVAQDVLDEMLGAAETALTADVASPSDDLYESQGWTSRFGRRSGSGAWLGGYMDSELRFDNVSDNGSMRFDQHRLIPFISAHLTDRIRFATEIELEHGGNPGDGDGAIKIEFAHMDWLLEDALNFRTGIILSPVGRLNVLHDSPLLDLTDRPLVNKYVIPTTLMESGGGFFGGWDLGEQGLLSYEVYAVNGFEGLEGDTSNFSTSDGLKNGKGSLKNNPDGQASFVGRLAYSPMLGLELGLSAHHGTYDDLGNNNLTLKAFDAFWSNGPMELKGEYAHAGLDRDGTTLLGTAVNTLVPDDMSGYYVEADYHFFPESWRGWDMFGQESTFTGVLRVGSVDLGGGEKDRITVGLNLRPVEDTVFKLEFQMNEEGGTLTPADFDTVVLSVATYF